MRTELKKLSGSRLTFTADVSRFSTKVNYGHVKETICFVDVKFSDGSLATDHLWFDLGKQIKSLNLKEGDTVKFDARIKTYIKGYINESQGIDYRTIDYRLSNVSKVSKINITKGIDKSDNIGIFVSPKS